MQLNGTHCVVTPEFHTGKKSNSTHRCTKYPKLPLKWRKLFRGVKSSLYVVKSSLILLFSGSHQFYPFFFPSEQNAGAWPWDRICSVDLCVINYSLLIGPLWCIMMENIKHTQNHIFQNQPFRLKYSSYTKFDTLHTFPCPILTKLYNREIEYPNPRYQLFLVKWL